MTTTAATAGREAESHTAVGVREMTRGWIMPGSMTITRTSDMNLYREIKGCMNNLIHLDWALHEM